MLKRSIRFRLLLLIALSTPSVATAQIIRDPIRPSILFADEIFADETPPLTSFTIGDEDSTSSPPTFVREASCVALPETIEALSLNPNDVLPWL